MKPRAPLLVCGSVAVTVTLFSIWLVRPTQSSLQRGVTVDLSGYTNTAKGCVAVFQLANRTSGAFCYHVGNFAFGISNGAVHNLGTGVTGSGGYVPAHGTLTFSVPVPPGTNEWRVLVEAWEVGRPYWSYSLGWRGKVASGLKDLGIYDADPKSYHITSPGFSRPSS